MHKLTNWTARRSGPTVTVHGTDADGNKTKITARSVDGPSPGRICAPESTVAWMLDGTPVQLAGPALTEDQKVRRVSAAVTQLEAELRSENRDETARTLVDEFAALPPASIATLHDIIVTA